MSRRSKNKGRGGILARLLFAPLMIIGAFVMLWLNEGRINFADVASGSQITAPDSRPDARPGQLLSITGRLATSGPIGDDLFLKPGAYALLERRVEMYAWVEDEESDDNGTTYSYELKWTDDPPDASGFEYPKDHQNPEMPYDGAQIAPQHVKLGIYELDPFEIEMPKPKSLALTVRQVIEGRYSVVGDYVYLGAGSLAEPLLGDVRISYAAVAADALVTMFADVQDGQARPHSVRGKATLYRVLEGTRDQAIGQLESEYRFQLWLFRFLGTALMWAGFAIIFSPINRLLGLVPGGEQIGCALTGAASLALALPLALMTILVSFVVHKPIILIVLLLLVLTLGFFLWRQRQRGLNRLAGAKRG